MTGEGRGRKQAGDGKLVPVDSVVSFVWALVGIVALSSCATSHLARPLGRGNVVVISEYLTQLMDPLDLQGPGFTIDQFKVFAIKSRVHFRRGFDDSGFAKTILLVEPEQPFLGTVRLEALPYRNVDISKFYPYGDVSFP